MKLFLYVSIIIIFVGCNFKDPMVDLENQSYQLLSKAINVIEQEVNLLKCVSLKNEGVTHLCPDSYVKLCDNILYHESTVSSVPYEGSARAFGVSLIDVDTLAFQLEMSNERISSFSKIQLSPKSHLPYEEKKICLYLLGKPTIIDSTAFVGVEYFGWESYSTAVLVFQKEESDPQWRYMEYRQISIN